MRPRNDSIAIENLQMTSDWIEWLARWIAVFQPKGTFINLKIKPTECSHVSVKKKKNNKKQGKRIKQSSALRRKKRKKRCVHLYSLGSDRLRSCPSYNEKLQWVTMKARLETSQLWSLITDVNNIKLCITKHIHHVTRLFISFYLTLVRLCLGYCTQFCVPVCGIYIERSR